MNKRGFTLIELLAVIVILAIIAFITVPLILNTIDVSKKEAFKDTAYGVIASAELVYTKGVLNGTHTVTTFTYVDGVESSSVEGKKLDYKGTKPRSGKIIINENGDISLAISDGEWCAEKTVDSEEVTISNKTVEECTIN